jgi:hypothetical protein
MFDFWQNMCLPTNGRFFSQKNIWSPCLRRRLRNVLIYGFCLCDHRRPFSLFRMSFCPSGHFNARFSPFLCGYLYACSLKQSVCLSCRLCCLLSWVTRWVCEKVAHNVAQTTFLSKLIHNYGTIEKGSAEMCTFVFKPLPKVNNHPLFKNSPNLVTLLLSAACVDVCPATQSCPPKRLRGASSCPPT